MPRKSRVPDCHPEKRHHAKGLCKSCYSSINSKEQPNYLEKARKRTAEWRKKNPEKSKEINRKYTEKRRYLSYGMTEEEYKSLLYIQNNCCAICQRELGPFEYTHTDHDHKTGQIRGILCHFCNTGLGMFKDDPARLHAAKQYLEKFIDSGRVAP